MRMKEERRKAKLKENIGVANVQSKVFEDPLKQVKDVIIEELPKHLP